MPTNRNDENENKKKDASHNKDEHDEKSGTSKRGFASMPHEQVVEIARKGGQHSHDHDKDKK